MATEKIQKIIDTLAQLGYEAQPNIVLKNNGQKRTGITVRMGAVSPTVYIDEMLETDVPVNVICGNIIDTAEANRPTFSVDSVVGVVESFENAKSFIRARLVNFETNREMLNALPHRIVFGDLAVYATINLGDGMSTKVTNEIMGKWGVPAPVILDTATENSVAEAKVCPMVDMLRNMLMDGSGIADALEECPMLVATNTDGMFGAAVMLKEEIFDGDVYIVPSSVHEVLVVDAKTTTREALTEMICDVNESCVSPDEVLSDHPYRFVNGKFVAEEAVA